MRNHANRSMQLFMVIILAMANIVVWSEIMGNVNRNATQYQKVDTLNAYAKPKPVWI